DTLDGLEGRVRATGLSYHDTDGAAGG
ncbi:MAG: hypothetical protein QOI26_2313, partial [Pseudonocardiales bacterium]|nr:hypothetical protein [Pseudonocardiales bacterium]